MRASLLLKVSHLPSFPPTDNKHYGTGYYMTVKTSTQTLLIDVRYERTTDIEILADRWIKGYYGENVQDIIKQF